jgi:glycosyltransferase involved in cell wall biosynthesis
MTGSGVARRGRLTLCFDGRPLGPTPTGAGKALARLLAALRQYHSEHEYVVLPGPGGVRLRRQLVWEQITLPRRARRLGADALHVAAGTAAPVLHSMPVVMTVHDLAPTRRPELLPAGVGRWYWSRWVPFTARFADHVIVPSIATRDDVVACTGLSPERVSIIPLANPLGDVAGATTDLEVSRVRRRHGLERPYVLYVGTIDRRKDHETLLDAVRALGDVDLVVAGTVIAGRTEFHQAIARRDMTASVRVLGYVPDTDLPGLYAGAAVFVYPSFFEGFGLPVLEAMACGTPVVTYRTTSLPEVVGDAGVLLDLPVDVLTLASAIRQVMEDDVVRQTLVKRGRDRACAFDWRVAAARTSAVYDDVVRRRRG